MTDLPNDKRPAISRRKLIIGGTAIAGAAATGAGGLAVRRYRMDAGVSAPNSVDDNGNALWSNWAGNQHAWPGSRLAPTSAEELASALTSAPTPIRAVGSGHSFTALVPTSGTIVTLDQISGLVSHDAATQEATVLGGTRLGDLGPALAAIGQEMRNLPDINKQSIAGALATGTHGTGKGIRALHGDVTALQIALPDGSLVDCSDSVRPELFHAARVGLGAFGIITRVTLRNTPLKRIRKETRIVDTDDVLKDWPTLREKHRNAEFLILPFTGKSLLITHDETQEPLRPRPPDRETDGVLELKMLRDWFEFAPGLRRWVAQREFEKVPPEISIDEGWKLLSNERPVRFTEMEYHLPIDAQVAALRETLTTIESHARDVFFPIEARIIAPDDAWLSPFYGRESGSIAVHAWYRNDNRFLFDLFEPIARRHGGRPHWGKLHSLKYRDLKALYPRFAEAMDVRRSIDPQGRMLNKHLRELLLDG